MNSGGIDYVEKSDTNLIDAWCFDKKSANTAASYSYDVEEMGKQFSEWKESGIRSVGFVHSHPSTYRQPSYDDIATARALMKFFRVIWACRAEEGDEYERIY